MDELTAIPGIGRSTAGDIVVGRPYDSLAGVPGADTLSPFVEQAVSDEDAARELPN
jgi:radical SAM superfamily enzyme with C-terminal helix-hairpin-helix motif